MKKTSSEWTVGTMGMVSGITLGVAAGLLCAPYSGRRTRKNLHQFASRTIEQAEDWIDNTKETIDDLVQRGKSAVMGA